MSENLVWLHQNYICGKNQDRNEAGCGKNYGYPELFINLQKLSIMLYKNNLLSRLAGLFLCAFAPSTRGERIIQTM